jgi:hypothetical protein
MWTSQQSVAAVLKARSPFGALTMVADESIRQWQEAVQALLILHTPLHPADNADFRELTRNFSALERLFIDKPALRWYYAECMGLKCDDVTRSADPCKTVNVAAMQLQLMEDAFFSLRLYQYANAPDNRGWMNLFRSWGRGVTFQRHASDLSVHFSARFMGFYRDYVENWPAIDAAPVPHAWELAPTIPVYEKPINDDLLVEEQRRRNDEEGVSRAKILAATYVDAAAESIRKAWEHGHRLRELKGIYLDRGRQEAGTPEGLPPGKERDPMPTKEREHGEAPVPPPGEPA